MFDMADADQQILFEAHWTVRILKASGEDGDNRSMALLTTMHIYRDYRLKQTLAAGVQQERRGKRGAGWVSV